MVKFTIYFCNKSGDQLKYPFQYIQTGFPFGKIFLIKFYFIFKVIL